MKQIELMLVLVVLTSACVGQTGDVMQNMLTLDVVKGGAEDIAITAKVPEFARTNQDFNWQLIARPTSTVRDFRIEVYDHCLFENKGTESFTSDKILPNNTQTFTLTYHTPALNSDRTCTVYFTSSYLSNSTLSTTVAVLKETEFMQRMQAGTLGEIPITTWSSTSPLELSVSWGPDSQPLLDNSQNQLHIGYANKGTGAIAKLDAGQVIIQVPENIEPSGQMPCDDYSWNPGTRTLTLNRQIDFIQKKAKTSTCTFTAKADQPVDSESLVVSAEYGYSIDGSVNMQLLSR